MDLALLQDKMLKLKSDEFLPEVLVLLPLPK